MLKLNAKGISHILIPLIVVVVGVAAFGTYKLVSSSAASSKYYAITPANGYSDVKRVISNKGRSHVVTDLSVYASCGKKTPPGGGCTVSIGGKEVRGSGSYGGSRGYSTAKYTVRVNGKHSGDTYRVKLYHNGRVMDSKSIRF